MDHCQKKERRGLKAFSAIILSIMHREKTMDYTQVAEAVISLVGTTAEDKNIRRRVYDALNVMCAAEVIRKEKKMLYLVDSYICSCSSEKKLPISSLTQIRSRVEEKRKALEETKQRKELLLSLIKRNKENGDTYTEKLFFPFILMSTQKSTRVDCETNDKRSYFKFIFNNSYRIYEDVYILRKLFKMDKDNRLYLLPESEEKENRLAEIQKEEPLFIDEHFQEKGCLPPSYLFEEEDDWLSLHNFLN